MWIYLVISILTIFLSSGGKKPKAKDAALGVAAGLGSYYVGTQTEWGRSTVSGIESSLGLNSSTTVPTAEGGAKTVITDQSGGVVAGLGAGISAGAKTLVPLAAAAAAGGVLASSSFGRNLMIGGAVLGAILLLRKKS